MGGVSKYFVYEHWRPDKDVCFYVGKGCGRRAKSKQGRNKYHTNIQNKLARMGMCLEVRLVASGLSEDEALELERSRIQFWKSLGVRISNIHFSGQKSQTMKWTDERKLAHSIRLREPETRAKRSASLKGRKPNLEHLAKLADAKRGVKTGPMPDWHKEKIRAAKLGEKHSKEWVRKVADAKRGKKLGPRSSPVSAEARKKMSDGMKAYHAKRRLLKDVAYASDLSDSPAL